MTTDDTLNQYPSEYRFRGYTPAELAAAFSRVCDPDDWRAPISAWVSAGTIDVVIAAIEFFTATEPKVAGLGVMVGKPGMVLVEAVGYRAGPAGP